MEVNPRSTAPPHTICLSAAARMSLKCSALGRSASHPINSYALRPPWRPVERFCPSLPIPQWLAGACGFAQGGDFGEQVNHGVQGLFLVAITGSAIRSLHLCGLAYLHPWRQSSGTSCSTHTSSSGLQPHRFAGLFRLLIGHILCWVSRMIHSGLRHALRRLPT